MKQWLYKQDEKPTIFEDEQINKAIESGWVYTPAKFARNTILEVKDLNSLTDEELRSKAKEAKIKSYHLLGRDKLIKALMES